MTPARRERMLDAFYLGLLSDRRRSVPGRDSPGDLDGVADVDNRYRVLLSGRQRSKEDLERSEPRLGFRA